MATTGLQLTKKSKTPHYDINTINIMSLDLMARLDELLDVLEVSLHKDNKKFGGPCPIHQGDKFNAFNLYHAGDECFGNWKCRTAGCERTFLPTIIGFIRGVLSAQKYQWSGHGDKTVSFAETLEFCSKFLEKDYSNLKINLHDVNKTQFIKTFKKANVVSQPTNLLTRKEVRSKLKIPSPYYIRRGYTAAVLDKYDVGMCVKTGVPMSSRTVVPIYDNDYKYMVGCTGRSLFEKCDKCGTWHNPEHSCPQPEQQYIYSKWKHSKDFEAENHLYNFWFARPLIMKTNHCFIVESPGNVLRMVEAGYDNVVGLFGTSLSNKQRATLDTSGALSLTIIMDNDESGAGQDAAKRIKEQCELIYHIKILTPPKNDLGEMSVQEIRQFLGDKI